MCSIGPYVEMLVVYGPKLAIKVWNHTFRPCHIISLFIDLFLHNLQPASKMVEVYVHKNQHYRTFFGIQNGYLFVINMT